MSTSYQATDRSSANFTAIFDAAIGEFKTLTKQDLGTHLFAVALGNSSSPESVLDVFRTQAKSFNRFREGDDKLMTWLTRIIHVILTLSGTFDEIGLVSPLPLCDILSIMSIFSAILARKTSLYWYWRSSRGQSLPTSHGVFTLYSSQAVRDVVASYEVLANLFEHIQFFLQRLDHYTAVTLTPDMMELLAKIMAQILSILALSTKIMKERKISGFISSTVIHSCLIVAQEKIMKRIMGRTDHVEDALKRLDMLTNEEKLMTAARTLGVAQHAEDKITIIEEVLQDVNGNVMATQELTCDIDRNVAATKEGAP